MRESETLPGSYSLSIRDQDSVKHYRIKNLDTGGFFIAMRRPFASLDELVTHYTMNADGLCSRLSNICPKGSCYPSNVYAVLEFIYIMYLAECPQTVGLSHMHKDKWEIDRSALKLRRKLGAGQFGEVWEGVWNNNSRVSNNKIIG